MLKKIREWLSVQYQCKVVGTYWKKFITRLHTMSCHASFRVFETKCHSEWNLASWYNNQAFVYFCNTAETLYELRGTSFIEATRRYRLLSDIQHLPGYSSDLFMYLVFTPWRLEEVHSSFRAQVAQKNFPRSVCSTIVDNFVASKQVTNKSHQTI